MEFILSTELSVKQSTSLSTATLDCLEPSLSVLQSPGSVEPNHHRLKKRTGAAAEEIRQPRQSEGILLMIRIEKGIART